ncbi:hypothetical protein AX15_001890 [Amanita polypyramis BW_CC]|nr:hypothetical protein AX15_001890 [Amanita polypyramis BW_CC]
MVLTLYGYRFSTTTKCVATVLHEKKVPFKFVNVDLRAGAQKVPEHLKIHPFGNVPVIDDDGFILYESRAIARYIATKYANQGIPLIPTELKANARFEQAASIEVTSFHPSAYGIAYEKLYKTYRGLELDEIQLKNHITTLNIKLDVYEAILSKQKYLAGDELTLADLFHLPFGNLIASLGVGEPINTRPNVKRWFEEISSRESWLAVKDEVESTA